MEHSDALQNARAAVLRRVAKTKIVCSHLEHVFEAMKISKHTALADLDLEKLRIKLSSLDLEGNSHGDNSAFFRALSKSELPEIEWEEVEFSEWTEGYSDEPRRIDNTLQSLSNQLWGAWLRYNKKQPWIQRKCYKEVPSIGTGEYTPDVPYEWQTHGDVEATSLAIPHCSFRVIHYADPGEPLRRSEVLPIVAYMRWRMIQFDYIEHYIFPVLVVSIFRSKVRLLQAYHDGEHLRISKSKFYDLTENISGIYELLIQWIHGIPCGDTEAPLHIKGEDLDDSTIKRIENILKEIFQLA
ncbi:hypothetical protein BDV28DRAFT_95356 [Aspergillus coremiiformis]|uniref:Uncharacterized protein n=1 Tax=Aspergillus coremiiformis TaxID=138285 RepID=A0A5N6Z8L9_9EURO|nr:hypothetical protein BDV28DRAFT_95356 [Aspergillus coremiiformis]